MQLNSKFWPAGASRSATIRDQLFSWEVDRSCSSLLPVDEALLLSARSATEPDLRERANANALELVRHAVRAAENGTYPAAQRLVAQAERYFENASLIAFGASLDDAAHALKKLSRDKMLGPMDTLQRRGASARPY